jgi:peptidoglycan glycosyltransferase
MNRPIRQLAVGLMALYVTLFAMLNYWQVGESEQLQSAPENTRRELREFNRPRGPIVTAEGIVAARSIPAPPGTVTEFLREYPTNDLFANVTGYHTFGFGSTQVEKLWSDELNGTTTEQQLIGIPGLVTGNADTSGTVVLTLREELQRTAKFLLGEQEGSIAMMDPTTGEVLALWSYPTYDPNLVADPDFDAAKVELERLLADPENPLLANAYQERYMPGSAFKIITTGLALEAGIVTTETVFPVESEWVPPQTTDPITNYGGTACGGTLAEVFARSCNIPFAQMAVLLGPDRFVDGTRQWGLEDDVPIDLQRPASSTLGDVSNLEDEIPLLAIRGFGQSEVQMVPIHMAMVAGAVANGGAMMEPYVVHQVLANDGRVLESGRPKVWLNPLRPDTAATLTDLMIGVAEFGTASCCIALEGGQTVAAKTGTAQLNETGEPERSHAWITAFAPAESPRYVVAVMLKGTNAEISAGTGGKLAGPIAKGMLDAAFAMEAGGG